jgi:energy-coupling factor transport system ATP-binding protein
MSYYQLEDINYTIKIKGASDKTVFEGLNFTCQQSDFLTLAGENGIGKTTLTKLLIGIIEPDNGMVLLDGKDVKQLKRYEVGKKIGYLFQNPDIQLFNRSIKEELYFAHDYGVETTGNIDDRYIDIIELLSLEKALNTPIVQLSQGERQRVAIGTILMNDPEFIILDEPTVGLDDIRKSTLKDTLIRLNKKNIGLLIISHDKGFIDDLPAKHLDMGKGGYICEHE